MEAVTFHFLPTTKPNSIEIRDWHLQRAEARSHAAKVSYARGKAKKRVKKDPKMTCLAGDTCENIIPLQGSTYQGNSIVQLPKLPSCISAGGLDPFLRVADSLSVSDCQKLQNYLVSNMQRNCPNGQPLIFCPVRDLLLPKLAMSATMVQCLMFISDLAVDSDCLLIHSRRYSMIKNLKRLIEEEGRFLQTSTAVTLATIIVAEYRVGDFKAAECHAIGLLGWILSHGGFEVFSTFDFFTGICLLNTFTYFEINIFQDVKQLEHALARLEIPTGYVVATLSKHLFPSDVGSQVAVLYLMNSLLQQKLPGFELELEHKVRNYNSIAPGAFLYAIGESVMRIGQWPALHSSLAIEFVRLLSFSTVDTKSRVLQHLAGNLNGVTTEEINLEMLKREIRAGWMAWKYGELNYLNDYEPADSNGVKRSTFDFSHLLAQRSSSATAGLRASCPARGWQAPQLRGLRCPMRFE